MRVWWRGPADNRVDVVTPAGETGTHRGPGATWTWEYETATATRAAANPLDLPAPPDLLPSSLGRRLLSEAADDELSRIGARRVAGRDALGLRLVPAAAASSVRRVDVWVDTATGLPLQVELVEKGRGRPALDTRFLDLDLAVPSAGGHRLRPAPGGHRPRGARGRGRAGGRAADPASSSAETSCCGSRPARGPFSRPTDCSIRLSSASRMPSPNSALSSKSEFDQAGPRPSRFTVYGVVGRFAP